MVRDPILQSALPEFPWGPEDVHRLPGTRALAADGWIMVDDAYAAQMALREDLIGTRRDAVIAALPGSEPAAGELLSMGLAIAPRHGFGVDGDRIVRPDGSARTVDRDDPLASLGGLFQEDFCLLEERDGAHVLVAAVLCFPSGWTLGDKIGHPMSRIHLPVGRYDADIARRVDRMLSRLAADRPVWRANLIGEAHAELFAPAPEFRPKARPEKRPPFLRMERQCLLRLPGSGAIAFTIHTAIVATGVLTEDARRDLSAVAGA